MALMDQVLSTKASFSNSGVSRGFEICGVVNSAETPLDDLIHEVRQPLGVIESLAYYLEITSVSEDVLVRLRQIQAMVVKANQILESARYILPERAV